MKKKTQLLIIITITILISLIFIQKNKNPTCIQPDFKIAYPYQSYNDGNKLEVESYLPTTWNEFIDLSEHGFGYLYSFEVTKNYIWVTDNINGVRRINKATKEIITFDLSQLSNYETKLYWGFLSTANDYYVYGKGEKTEK